MRTTPPRSLWALFNATCARLSLVRFPPQDILTPFHRVTGILTHVFAPARKKLKCVWAWIDQVKTTGRTKTRLSLAALLWLRHQAAQLPFD